MGLVARVIEAHGIPTLVYCTVRDITAQVKPPRSAFLDYPVGNTVGRPNDAENQLAILKAGLGAAAQITEPGTIVDLPFTWSGDDRSWEEDIRAIYFSKRGNAILKRQRILLEHREEEFADELRKSNEILGEG